MSAGLESGDGSDADLSPSRQSNQNKSVNSATADSPPSQEQVVECVTDFAKKYPERARLDLATGDGTTIRREYANVETVEWEEDLRLSAEERERLMLDRPMGTADGEVSPISWAEGIRTLLEREAVVQGTTINLERRHLNDVEEYDVPAQTRWSKPYQKKYNAQIDAWLRELVGGERPSGGVTAPSYEDPHIALITLSASSVPDGDRVGPVDHLEALQDSWRSTYHALRNRLRSLGFDSSEWQYDRRAEPHKNDRGDGRGVNECYGHEHVVLVVDGEVTSEDLRPVVEKHVEANEWAGEAAHGEDAVEVRTPEDLEDPAAYVSDYCSIDPVGLFDRSPSYQAWAAAATAASYRTVTRSEAARAAATADRCRQRAESSESDQVRRHGEEVRRSDGEVVCLCCGTSHDIDQEQTLVEQRRPETAGEPTVADGGGSLRTAAGRREELEERWPSARAAASVGESTERARVRERIEQVAHAHGELSDVELAAKYDAIGHVDVVREVRSGANTDPSEVVGFECPERPARWRVVSVTVDGEVHPASGGGGVETVTNTNYADRFDWIRSEWYRCDCGVKLHGEQIAGHLGHVHGIEDPAVARRSVRYAGTHMPGDGDGDGDGMGYPDRYGDADRARSDRSDGSRRPVSWICSDCNCGVRIGNDCPGCGASEPEDSVRV